MMQCPTNKALVRVDTELYATTDGGLVLPKGVYTDIYNLNAGWSADRIKVVEGEVVAVPMSFSSKDTLLPDSRRPGKMRPYSDFTQELNPGDKVYFRYSAIHSRNSHRINDETLYEIDYDKIFAIDTAGHPYPIGGKVLLKPEAPPTPVRSNKLDVPFDGVRISKYGKPMAQTGRIVAIGKPLKGDTLPAVVGDLVAVEEFCERSNFGTVEYIVAYIEEILMVYAEEEV